MISKWSADACVLGGFVLSTVSVSEDTRLTCQEYDRFYGVSDGNDWFGGRVYAPYL